MKTIMGSGEDKVSKDFINEIKIMGYVDPHLNLVSMIGFCTEIKNDGENWLLLEFCRFGDLKQYLVDNNNAILRGLDNDLINPRSLIKWVYDIAKGMEYLISKKIMHGDLAARNVMLSESPMKNGHIVAMVADFGLSKNFYGNVMYEKSSRLMVPWRWMAFEYLTKGYFTLKSDVWSFAVLLWEILSFGRVPYGMHDYDETLEKLEIGYRLPCPSQINVIKNWCPKDLYDTISNRCFVDEPTNRADFKEVVEIIETYLNEDEITIYLKMKEEYNAKAKKYFNINQQSATQVL